MRATNLTCEYLSSPLGVDTPSPRFGWRLIDPDGSRGQCQSAFQMRVERKRRGERIPLWDSGKVEGAQSVNVAYAGPPMGTAWDLHWRVRAWAALSSTLRDEPSGSDSNERGVEGDMAGEPTEWSDEARVVTGVMDAGDWKGEWIRCAQAEAHQHCWFRKTFTAASVPGTAIMYICSIGYHEIYVTGRRIGDAVLTPGVTNLQKRALYMTYDIANALMAGENVIAVWTGPGWARADGSFGKGVWDQTPMFRCQLHMEGEAVLSSAADWRSSVSASENIGLWKGGGKGTYGGERIDARRDQPGWSTVGFDDSHWSLSETARSHSSAQPPCSNLIAKSNSSLRFQSSRGARPTESTWGATTPADSRSTSKMGKLGRLSAFRPRTGMRRRSSTISRANTSPTVSPLRCKPFYWSW